MNINIYQKYIVRIKKEWIELSEENETIYDNIFEKGSNDIISIIDGGELLDKIADNLKRNYFSEFVVVGKKLHFEYFNYNNGESEHICYEILEDLESKGE